MDPRVKKPHAVCIPAPAQGHINAMLQLAKLLHSSFNFHITFVLTHLTYDRILATSGPSALSGLPGFRFANISDGLPGSTTVNGEDVSVLMKAVRNNLAGPFRQLLKELNEVTCVVSDTFSSYTLDIAAELGIPDVSFCSVGAGGFWGFFAYQELMDRGIVPLKNKDDLTNGYLDTPIDCIPAMNKMRLKDFPSYVRTTDPHCLLLNFCKDESQDARRASAVIINTFDDLEAPVLDAMSAALPPVYAVGPLNLMCHEISDESIKSIRSSLWGEDSGCLRWLDAKAENSVIYVNFGSMTVMSRDQLLEFAWGLADCGHDFLWVIRPDIVSGDSTSILPEELLLEIGERGLLISWCPQEKVLMHASVGGFLTHCGWNSTMESISWGVPMICWPYFGDQQTNCWYLCNEWGVGVEVENDVKREDVARVIREVLGGEKGMQMRRMANKWKDRATMATALDGKSFKNLERVIKEVLIK